MSLNNAYQSDTDEASRTSTNYNKIYGIDHSEFIIGNTDTTDNGMGDIDFGESPGLIPDDLGNSPRKYCVSLCLRTLHN